MTRLRTTALVTMIATLAITPSLAERAPAGAHTDDVRCLSCHGDLELLRSRVLARSTADSLHVVPALLRASAHGEMACSECHEGIREYPHPDLAPAAATCQSCHEEVEADWTASIHGTGEAGPNATCASCHTVHAVREAHVLSTPEGRPGIDTACATCHDDHVLADADPHRGEAACFECHGAHDTPAIDHVASWTHATRQPTTCGACHDSVSVTWSGDAHGLALLGGGRGAIDPANLVADGADPVAPACTACHGSHPTATVGERAFDLVAMDRCATCHPHFSDTASDTYHTKAARLGSLRAATCADCHGAHGVHPAEHPASLVHPDRLVATCGTCHEEARESFVLYEPHPETWNFDKNPQLTVSTAFMLVLLTGVLGVFGLHTVVWFIRIVIDRRRALRILREREGDTP